MVFGTGSFWSDNQRNDGTYYDVQFSYLRNIKFKCKEKTTSIQPEIIIDNNDKPFDGVKVEYYNLNGMFYRQ